MLSPLLYLLLVATAATSRTLAASPPPIYDPPLPTTTLQQRHDRTAQLRHTNLATPITKTAQYQAAADVLESLRMDEDATANRQEYSVLPGAMYIGMGLNMVSGSMQTRIL